MSYRYEKMKVEIELEFNAIMFVEDVKPEVQEWLETLQIRHLVNKKLKEIKFYSGRFQSASI